MGKIEYDQENEMVTWKQSVKMLEKQLIGWRMLENNRIEGIIPFVYYYVDDEVCFCYSVRQWECVTDTLLGNNLGFQDIYDLCNGILQVLSAGEEYLLRNEEYLILPEYLFWNPYDKKIFLCYLPGRERGTKGDFLTFVEILMKNVNHKDQRAVNFIYGLYDVLRTKGFEVQGLLDYTADYVSKREERTITEETARGKKCSKKQCYYLVPLGNRKEEDTNTDMRKYVLKGISRNNCKLYEKENQIGRAKSADIVLPFPEISREHASVCMEGNKVYVTDCHSKNGTYINGRKLSAHRKTQCTPKDTLTFADISFRLEL